jgi:hypothetical protein
MRAQGKSTTTDKERLKLKRTLILKQHREGYKDDEEFHGEIECTKLVQ